MTRIEQILLMQVDQYLQKMLKGFAESRESGIITIEIPVHDGEPKSVNMGAKENRPLINRDRHKL